MSSLGDKSIGEKSIGSSGVHSQRSRDVSVENLQSNDRVIEWAYTCIHTYTATLHNSVAGNK
jgi:hypothetical protein